VIAAAAFGWMAGPTSGVATIQKTTFTNWLAAAATLAS
jgi:hypothetical protein